MDIYPWTFYVLTLLILTTTQRGKFGTIFTEETMAQKNNLFMAAVNGNTSVFLFPFYN